MLPEPLEIDHWLTTDSWLVLRINMKRAVGASLTKSERDYLSEIDLKGLPWNLQDEGHKHRLEKLSRSGY